MGSSGCMRLSYGCVQECPLSSHFLPHVNGITRADNTTKGTDINKQCKLVLQYHIILFPHDMFQLYRAIIRCFNVESF
jgi:hypothetical protein